MNPVIKTMGGAAVYKDKMVQKHLPIEASIFGT